MQQHHAVRRGRVAEHLAAAWLLQHLNVFVATPPDPSDTDLLVELEDGTWVSIQVKLAYWRNDELVANVSKSNGKPYTTNYIMAVDVQDGGAQVFCLVPTNKVNEKSRMKLSDYSSYLRIWEDVPNL